MNIPLLCCTVLITLTQCCKFSFGSKLDFKDIVFTVLSQHNERHENKALKIKNEITKDTNSSSTVFLSHIDLKNIGDWTVIPILPMIWKKHKQKFSWMIFCTDDTKINVLRLKEILENISEGVTFIGRALKDKEPTIIHHFNTNLKFQYPLFASGFGVHYDLMQILVEKINNGQIQKKIDFSIDASHELALFIKENANDVRLTHSQFFCTEYKKNCATHIRNNFICEKQPVDIKKIFFAVKTCEKYYNSRVPVVQQTWGQWTQNLVFYSNTHDENIPTVQLKVPNTEKGHCGKTEAIIKEIKKNMENDPILHWAVISDDDTLFSTYRLQELLGCYNHTEPIALGERYGYAVTSKYGYNYITGGGGIVLSRKAVTKLSEGNCACPSNSTPDDMFLLGVCLHQLKISIVHIPLFHQARPNDYNEEYLLVGPPISFHKHWMVDPILIYKNWFQLSDLLSQKKNNHIEL